MPTGPRTYLLVFALLAGGSLAGLAWFNLRVDPYGLYGLQASKEYAPYRGEIDSRVFKAEQMLRGEWDIILLGNSRTQVGIEPKLGGRKNGPRIYNAALRGGSMYECEQMLRLAVDRPGLQQVVLFTDFVSYKESSVGAYDFEHSRLNPALDAVDYHLGILLGAHGTEESQHLRERAEQGKPGRLDARGFQGSGRSAKAGTLEAFRDVLANNLARDGQYGGYQLGSRHLESLRASLALCTERGITMRVAIPPIHAVLLEAIRARGLWDAYELWKREVVAAVEASGQPPLIDFTTFEGFAGEPLTDASGRSRVSQWYRDPSHFNERLGRRLLRRVLGQGGDGDPPLGVELSVATLEEHLEQTRRQRDAWAARCPDDAALVADIERRADARR